MTLGFLRGHWHIKLIESDKVSKVNVFEMILIIELRMVAVAATR